MKLMKRFRIDLRSLPAQTILSFIGLVFLTAAAAGLPSIWLIRDQLDRQAWAQVEHGGRAARALYAAQQSEIAGLATLTAQRPTLRDLLTQGDQASMQAYLRTLQTGAGLDLVLVCDSNRQAVAQAGEAISDALCAATPSVPINFRIVSAGTAPLVWLFATQPIGNKDADSQGTVIAGLALDDKFAVQMRSQTGLEHTLLVDGQPVATSLDGGITSRRSARSEALDSAMRSTFTLENRPYYASRFPLSEPGDGQVEAEVSLAVADIVATRRSLAWTLARSIVVVAVVGSVLGTLLARRISRPLAHLTEAATALSKGDLDSSVAVEARVREIALVAQALERARIDLQRTLTELRQEKAWTDHLLEAFVEGIITLDHQGRITFFSRGAERITGWDRDRVLNRSCDEVFRPVETGESFSQSIPPPGRRHKITVELADGHQATLAVTGARLMPPEAGSARAALVFRDVSEEEAVHRLIGHFLANVAHEFRTPLSALAASVELLLDQAPDLSPAELRELLTSLHLGILGLQTLVDNLLESASIEAGRFRVHPRPSNLGRIIAETIRTMQPLLDKHGQRLVLELPVAIPVVQADSRRIVQVLVNLLSNASKYGPDDAEITIGALLTESWVRVTVTDRGPGVRPEHRHDLFRRFVYADSDSNKTQYGVGLGLSVVKAVIEAHGGQVGVEDGPGGGSAFWFTLPVESEV
jgi:two-component system phosphate regulon sensor histidine kinase PhoR